MAGLLAHNLAWPPAYAPPLLNGDRTDGVERLWYALYTLPQNERSVARYLGLNAIESFLPTCESIRRWKNRQRVKVVEALFPTYLFIKIHSAEQALVLRSPGVRKIVGNHKGPVPLPTEEIESLRSGLNKYKLEPYRELVIGEKVRIKSGSMQGLEGVLVRKKNNFRFVLTLELINQHAAVDISADELEPVPN